MTALKEKRVFRKSRKMHFIGIGGAGMCGIAEILINLGYEVSGSDLKESDTTRRLAEMGAKIFIGHYPSNIGDYSVVITSTAVNLLTNPEVIEARSRKIPVIHRSEMLSELVRLKYGIGVAGTHGKTTTSSMMAHVMWHAGQNPTSVIGGKVLNFGSNARAGEGEYLVFEADESDGSFLKLLPAITVVTNIDADHLDHYKYFEGIKDAFLQYMNNIPFYGYSVICIDDPVVAELLPKIERPYVTYGFREESDFRAANLHLDGETSFDCYYKDKKLGRITMQLLGRHNVLNALSVVAVASELEIPFAVIADALADFKGVGRRLELIGEADGITILDDYGHHPTEIRATLDALRTKGRRIAAVFQPHRYSRTQHLAEDFGKCFGGADLLFLTEIYPAGEAPIEGVSSRLIADAVERSDGRTVTVIPRFEDIAPTIAKSLKKGDILVTLGAGDITKAGPLVLEELKKK
jgi:UDP-N-acetylmuramate--alanine ligase